ncbi:2-amino-4-hydroxy-6-hydroxymethyldihydropteridine diphosphokinase [Sphingomonas sp. ID1715]|uniref:2-amino-4-hydroxy-6- hydroxymethyldihydropteridine diphosphokinase n=1 Tax=Sphingomonas sp. ID1715 TaxID=1656898 RepID=UPI001488D827|nr:2-amino-4-hydroxy-6-hydroxymethyldihydropteridine diphosphokinase [Sphingomonas sp. ID1715]
MTGTSYAIAIGSNRRHHRHGLPDCVIAAAVQALAKLGEVQAVSRTHATAAMGPAGRRFANAAVLLRTDRAPPALLQALKALERQFGRRPGRRWGPRVLDLDIILWSGGSWSSGELTVPHPAFRERSFVLGPLTEIAPGWRDPLTGRTVRQLAHASERRPVRA